MINSEGISIYELYGTQNTSCFDKYGEDVKKAYFKRVNDFFLDEGNIGTKDSIREEFNRILNESKVLLSRDPAFGLLGLVDYINQQKRHISTIRYKIGSQDITYAMIVTFVVKVAIFDIEETIFLEQLMDQKYHMSISKMIVTHERNLWEAIKLIDNLDMLLAYKHDVYEKKREEYKRKCILKNIDTRTPQQVKKDNISNTVDSMSGCIFLFVFFLICILIGAIIK